MTRFSRSDDVQGKEKKEKQMDGTQAATITRDTHDDSYRTGPVGIDVRLASNQRWL
ncbi:MULTISPECIES: hypothetical protein [unclassified Oceanobacter]|uniref:hypothetical protein n=1 Tax=unclassified Oceanobacter TaxID=2620260 RepID=UPI002732A5B5|nr:MULTISPECIES: hypothetical protein [unclassified Oceanobacter]MDP2506287.1 hypothetical protein [Oceanobacter sp. 3_MG-2023]MDP2546452.1 hypothetical protein [Oceanobacter sp. 4_MG-2023]